MVCFGCALILHRRCLFGYRHDFPLSSLVSALFASSLLVILVLISRRQIQTRSWRSYIMLGFKGTWVQVQTSLSPLDAVLERMIAFAHVHPLSMHNAIMAVQVAESLRFPVCAASRGESNGSDDMEHALPAVYRSSSAGELARRACFCPWRICMSTVASNLSGAICTSFLTYYHRVLTSVSHSRRRSSSRHPAHSSTIAAGSHTR